MRITDIKSRTDAELEELLEQKRKRLFDIRFEATSTSIQNPHEAKGVRRDIARIITVLKERTAGAVVGEKKAGGKS